MKNPSKKLITLMLLFVMIIVGCTQPDMQDGLKTLTPEEQSKAPVVATIWLPDFASSNARTILPGTLETPASYRVTLNYEKGPEGSITPTIVVNPGKIDITNVVPGKYSIKVEGLNAEGKVILSGTNGPTEIFEVVEDKVQEITIYLHAVKNVEETGNISVTFNWDTILNMIPAEPTEEDLIKLGPISNAIHDGYLKFELYVYSDDDGAYVSHSTDEWDMKSQTWDEIKAVNSYTCLFKDIKATDVFVNFSILNKDNVVLASHVFNEIAKVYVGQTSYYEGDISNEFNLNKTDDVYSYNIRNLEVGYPLDAETEDKEFVITWNEPCEFASIDLQLWTEDAIKGTPIVISDPSLKKATIAVQPNTNYYITSKAKSTDGTTSNIKAWKRDDGSFFRAKEKISSIEYTGNIPTTVIKSGDSFEITATIAPTTATYQNLTWEPTTDETLYITNSTALGTIVNVRANKPGVTGIMVSNNDPFNGWARETGHKLEIKLATPIGLQSSLYYDLQGQLRGVTLDWNQVSYAENYNIYRRVNSNGEFHLLATTENGETEYNDKNVEYGKTYEYQIEAIAPVLESQIKEKNPTYNTTTSDKSATSEKVTLPTPHINMQIVDIENLKITLTDNTATGSAVYTHENDQLIQLKPNENRTIMLASEIPGATNYAWYVNGKHAKPNLEGDYNTAKSFTIGKDVEYLKMNTPAPQELMLVVTKGSENYSMKIRFTVIQETVKGVEWDASKKPASRISAADTESNRKIHAKVTNENATIQDVYYELAPGSDPSTATIDKYSGEITILKGGTATFRAYSAETNEIITPDTLSVEVYVPTIESAEALIGEINTILAADINSAGKTFIADTGDKTPGDWWMPGSKEWNNTIGKVNPQIVSIKTNGSDALGSQLADKGGIYYENKSVTLGDLGAATFNTPSRIAIWSINGNKTGGHLSRDPMERIGFTDSNFTRENTLVITLPENQGTARVKFDNVYVTPGSTSGSYEITFSEDILGYHGSIEKYDAQAPNPKKYTVDAVNAPNKITVK